MWGLVIIILGWTFLAHYSRVAFIEIILNEKKIFIFYELNTGASGKKGMLKPAYA